DRVRRGAVCRGRRLPVRQPDRTLPRAVRLHEQLQHSRCPHAAEKGAAPPMAATDWKPSAAVESAANLRALLEREPYAVEFFQAVQLLERIYPHRDPVGGFSSPAREVVRFATHNRLSFPASEIQRIDWPTDAPPVMAVNFL